MFFHLLVLHIRPSLLVNTPTIFTVTQITSLYIHHTTVGQCHWLEIPYFWGHIVIGEFEWHKEDLSEERLTVAQRNTDVAYSAGHGQRAIQSLPTADDTYIGRQQRVKADGWDGHSRANQEQDARARQNDRRRVFVFLPNPAHGTRSIEQIHLTSSRKRAEWSVAVAARLENVRSTPQAHSDTSIQGIAVEPVQAKAKKRSPGYKKNRP